MASIQNTPFSKPTGDVIAAAIKVHRALGPGLLESACMACLLFELRRSGFQVETQRAVPVIYDGVSLDCGYRLEPQGPFPLRLFPVREPTYNERFCLGAPPSGGSRKELL
jgi:PD-(D/E)XK nuclease superfamily